MSDSGGRLAADGLRKPRRVLVTGGSMGIGLAVAQSLAEQGARLVLVARGKEDLARAHATLSGDHHVSHAFDVSDESAWEDVDTEELDGLVCAAAVIEPIGPIGSYAPSGFLRALEINVLGTFLAINHCLPALRETGGAIVTFGGGGATSPQPRFDAYATSKAAVARLTENLALSIAPVKLNCVAPGLVATRMVDKTLAAGPDAVGRDHYEKTYAEARKGGFPVSEAAELVGLLLSGVPFTGKLVSAQWDPWRDAAFHRRLANDPAFGAIRRIDGMNFDAVSK